MKTIIVISLILALASGVGIAVEINTTTFGWFVIQMGILIVVLTLATILDTRENNRKHVEN